MPLAMSRAVVPEGTSLTLPSGSFTWMSSDMMFVTYGCAVVTSQSAIAENFILVVIAGLMEPDLGRRNFINESVLLRDSARPKTGQIELEQFRFADSGKWIL